MELQQFARLHYCAKLEVRNHKMGHPSNLSASKFLRDFKARKTRNAVLQDEGILGSQEHSGCLFSGEALWVPPSFLQLPTKPCRCRSGGASSLLIPLSSSPHTPWSLGSINQQPAPQSQKTQVDFPLLLLPSPCIVSVFMTRSLTTTSW